MRGKGSLLVLVCAGAVLPAAVVNAACPVGGPAVTLSGTISQLHGDRLVIVPRTGLPVMIDAAPALAAWQSTPLIAGRAVEVLGRRGADGVVHADVIRRIKDSPASWGADCPPAAPNGNQVPLWPGRTDTE